MKLLLLLLFLFIPLALYAPTVNTIYLIRSEPLSLYRIYFDATAQIETNNVANRINLSEGAFGILQIRKGKLSDFNKANHTNYTLFDCLDVEVSRAIYYWHLSQYKNLDYAVRKWNGDIKSQATLEYLKRIKSLL